LCNWALFDQKSPVQDWFILRHSKVFIHRYINGLINSLLKEELNKRVWLKVIAKDLCWWAKIGKATEEVLEGKLNYEIWMLTTKSNSAKQGRIIE